MRSKRVQYYDTLLGLIHLFLNLIDEEMGRKSASEHIKQFSIQYCAKVSIKPILNAI